MVYIRKKTGDDGDHSALTELTIGCAKDASTTELTIGHGKDASTDGTDNGAHQGCQHSFLDTPHGYMLSFSKQTHMYPFSLSY